MQNFINFVAENSWGSVWKELPDAPPMINQHTEEKRNWSVHSRSCLVEVFRAVQNSHLRSSGLIRYVVEMTSSCPHHPLSCQSFVSNLSTVPPTHWLGESCWDTARNWRIRALGVLTGTALIAGHTTTLTVGETCFTLVIHNLGFMAVATGLILLVGCKLIFGLELVVWGCCCTCRE